MKNLSLLLFVAIILLSNCEKEDDKNFDPEVKTPVDYLDSLNPGLLSKTALNDFEESIKVSNIINTHDISINYMPDKEISVNSIENGLLKYEFSYTLEKDGQTVESAYEITDNSIIVVDSKHPLEFEKEYILTAKAVWKKKLSTQETWTNCDSSYNEKISLTILTNESLEDFVVDTSDILFQYPLNRQFNYLEEEYEIGYFKLISSKQKHLMSTKGLVKIQHVRSNSSYIADLEYNSELEVFEFELHAEFLENDNVYKISLFTNDTSDLIYSYFFKTSKYNSFTEKWGIIKTGFNGGWRDNVYNYDYPYSQIFSHVQKINMNIEGEILDFFETNQNRFNTSSMPLIQFETHVPSIWKNTADWKIYEWNTLSLERTNTDCKKYGFPPLRAIYFYFNKIYAIKLSDNSVNGEIEYPELPELGLLVWEVQNFMAYDAWTAYENALLIDESDRGEYQEIAASQYTDMDRLHLDFALGDDTYPLVDVYYVLPGINIETTVISNFQLHSKVSQ